MWNLCFVSTLWQSKGEIAWCRARNRCFFQISRPLEGACVAACSPKHSFLGGRWQLIRTFILPNNSAFGTFWSFVCSLILYMDTTFKKLMLWFKKIFSYLCIFVSTPGRKRTLPELGMTQRLLLIVDGNRCVFEDQCFSMFASRVRDCSELNWYCSHELKVPIRDDSRSRDDQNILVVVMIFVSSSSCPLEHILTNTVMRVCVCVCDVS